MKFQMVADDIKDVELINWLKSKTNVSSFMRYIMYEYKMKECGSVIENIPIKKEQSNILSEVCGSILNSINNN